MPNKFEPGERMARAHKVGYLIGLLIAWGAVATIVWTCWMLGRATHPLVGFALFGAYAALDLHAIARRRARLEAGRMAHPPR